MDDGMMRLSTFYDYARGRDKFGSMQVQSISSAGIGLDWQINKDTYAKLLWGIPFREIDYSGNSDLQDAGIHVEFTTGF